MILQILIGCGRAGKSTYAQKLTETGYEHLSLDHMYCYGNYGTPQGEIDYFAFLDKLSELLNSKPDTDFVLDGYLGVGGDPFFTYLRTGLKFHEIKSTLVFTNYKLILERDVALKIRRLTKERITSIYHEYTNLFSFDEFVEGVGNNRCVKTDSEAMHIVMNNEE